MFRYAALLALLLTTPALAGENDRYLPENTELVLRLQVRDLLDVPALKNDKDTLARAKKLVLRLASDYEQALQHLDAAGVDLYRDVQTVTVALPGDADGNKAFLVVEGKFDPAKFQAAAEAAAKKPDGGLKVVQVAGRPVYELKLPGLGQPVFVCLVDESTLLAAGGKDRLAAALGKVKDKGEAPKKVQPLLKLLDGKQHLGFAGTRAAMVKVLAGLPLPQADLLPAVLEEAETIHGGFVVGKEAEMVLRFTTRDEKTARQFFQQLTLVVAVARGAINQKAKEDARYVPLAEAMKTLRTGVEDNAVVWRAQMSLVAAEKLLEGLGK
jgi:hypothetical protein